MSEHLSKRLTEAWLQACPTGILALRDKQVIAANPALEQLTRIPAQQLIGQHIDDADNTVLQRLLSDAELIELSAAGQQTRWLKCTLKRLEEAPDKPLQLLFYQDVSEEIRAKQERDLLARKVEELDLTDALTGLANPRALGNALTAQVTRSRRYQNALSLALVEVRVNPAQTPLPDSIILKVSQFLRDRLRWADVIGRYSDNGFMLILPETEQQDADQLMSNICAESANLTLPQPYEQLSLQLDFGAAQWRKGMDTTRMVEQAQHNLGQTQAPPIAEPG
jgi:diguanylate cyclase (GGDEF)-like protein